MKGKIVDIIVSIGIAAGIALLSMMITKAVYKPKAADIGYITGNQSQAKR